MMTQTIQTIRNIGIMAHVDAGKTTLTERILFNTGRIHKIGDVHHGNTTTDSRATEQKHGITISAAATSCNWNDHHITILDTPGHVDFTIEVERSLRVLDGAVAVFSAVAGVEPQSETVWHQADRYDVPRICFINKMDSVGANYQRCVEMIQEQLGATTLSVHLPIDSESDFRGLIDLVTLTAWLWSDGKLSKGSVPAERLEHAQTARALLVEQLAEVNETCAAAWLKGSEIEADILSLMIRESCLKGQVTPVLCGSAFCNIGVQPLLDAIVAWCPSPADRPAIEGVHPDTEIVERRAPTADEALTGLVAKVQVTRFGPLATVRLYSGKLIKGQNVLISNSGAKERVGRILRMHADQSTDLDYAGPGDVVSVTGLKSAKAGDTLCDSKAPIRLEGLECPAPVIEAVIEPVQSIDQEKLGACLAAMVREDPSLHVRTDPETGQVLIAGMGELHLQICLEELETTHELSARLGRPRVSYREALTAPAVIDHTFRKQSGGPGQFARVKIRFAPADDDQSKGLEFESVISGGAIPMEFIPAVERGLEQAMCEGPLCGFPLMAMKATLEDGAFHANDSSAIAFERAAREAFRKAAMQTRPVVLEPIMQVNVTSPEVALGSVIGNLNARRARIVDIMADGPRQNISAHVPLAEMFGYVSDLRSLSSGRASFNMKFDHYAPLPASLQTELIDK